MKIQIFKKCIFSEIKIGIYLCFVAHGVCYIPALTYINIRAANDSPRNINVSIAHVFYFFGAAIAASLIRGVAWTDFHTLTRNVGIFILCTSCVIFVLLGACECLRNKTKMFAYKQSLDKNLQSQNATGRIFSEQYYAITENLPELNFRKGNLVAKEVSMIVYVLLSKSTSIIYYYYPFYFYVHLFTNLSSGLPMNMSASYVHWNGLIGIILSTILLIWFSPKSSYLFTTMFKIFWLILCTILVATSFGSTGLTAMFWILFVVNAMGHSYPDIFILDYATLKFNEFIMALCYLAEMMTIGSIFFAVLINPHGWVPIGNSSDKYMIGHCLAFGLIFLHLIISGLVILPAIHNKSLLETKNLCWLQFYGMQKTVQKFVKCQCCECCRPLERSRRSIRDA